MEELGRGLVNEPWPRSRCRRADPAGAPRPKPRPGLPKASPSLRPGRARPPGARRPPPARPACDPRPSRGRRRVATSAGKAWCPRATQADAFIVPAACGAAGRPAASASFLVERGAAGQPRGYLDPGRRVRPSDADRAPRHAARAGHCGPPRCRPAWTRHRRLAPAEASARWKTRRPDHRLPNHAQAVRRPLGTFRRCATASPTSRCSSSWRAR